ncbi:MAG TPA: hypothetical protein VGB68_15805 [Pyrinomonadaceae bacterium]|jgi:hypothetical protein
MPSKRRKIYEAEPKSGAKAKPAFYINEIKRGSSYELGVLPKAIARG